MYENKRNYHSKLLHNVFQGINYIFQKPSKTQFTDRFNFYKALVRKTFL